MCSKTTVAPLDRIKILLQAHNEHYKNFGEYLIEYNWKLESCHLHWVFKNSLTFTHDHVLTGVISGLKEIVKRESFFALYKGNTAQMVRIFPYAALQFTSFEIYKNVSIQINLCPH
mgnify:CR=1 FL=1